MSESASPTSRLTESSETTELLGRLNTVLEEAGIYVAAEVRDGILALSGEVDSAENRQAALDVATALAAPSGLTVEDDIDVLVSDPESAFADADDDAFSYVDPESDNDGQLDAGFETEGDFTGNVGTTDSEEAAAEATPYFPPTDPVVSPSSRDDALVIRNGFAATATDDEETAAGFDERNDDEISRMVLRELLEDALTTDLVIPLSRGTAPSICAERCRPLKTRRTSKPSPVGSAASKRFSKN